MIKKSNISIAVMYAGNRADRMIEPLKTTDMQINIEPDNPYSYDAVLLDNADRNIIWPTIKKRNPLTDTKVIYRMRGDIYEEISRWHMNPFKEWVALKILADSDGFICVNEGMKTKAKRHSGVESVGVAGLHKNINEWPTIQHQDRKLRFITLSNLDYFEKTEPIAKYAGVVEEHCKRTGGYWDIYGNGVHSEWLKYVLEQYDLVNYQGYTDTVKETMREYNTMLHLSELDALPNSVLEGLASNLPVITTNFYAFTESKAPLQVIHGKESLIDTMNELSNTKRRKQIGLDGREYMQQHHTKEKVGKQYSRFFQDILS